MEPDIVTVTFTSSNEEVDNWESRKVGTRDLTVVVEPPAMLGGMLSSVMERMEALENREALLAAPRMRNTAAQVLLHAVGKASFRTTATDYYSKMGSAHAGVQQLASALMVAPEQLVQQADQLISRRNAGTHCGSLAQLDEEVQEVKGLISPRLQQLCRWECLVIEQYAAVKAAFADHF